LLTKEVAMFGKRPKVDVTKSYYAEGRPPSPMTMKVEFDVVADANEWAAARGVPANEAQADFRDYVTAAYRDLQARMLADGVFPVGSQIVG
jgi:hypothetical protein